MYIIIILALILLSSGGLFGGKMEIDNSRKSIKSALDKSESGDTIIISGGYFNESNIVIDKPITLIGIYKPVIDAKGADEIFIIRSDSVSVSGFSLKNTKYNFIKDNAAILIDRRKNISITDNIIDNTFFGVYLKNSSDCRIIGNVIEGIAKKEAISGNAVHLWYCSNIEVRDNVLKGHRDGIYLEFSKGCLIQNNHSENNLRYGLHFMFSDSCNYIGNHFIRNSAGVAVMYSKEINMFYNEFSENQGTASYGLLLKDITGGRISKNKFIRNTIGIFAESTKNMNIIENEFRYNAWAFKLLTNSYDNFVTENNFIGNTMEMSTNRGNFRNYLNGNYWSDYSGYDLNNDGTGDVPHRPMSLFAYLTENFPTVLILNRSLFVNILILAERLLPSIIPKYILDETPKMNPFKIEFNPENNA